MRLMSGTKWKLRNIGLRTKILCAALIPIVFIVALSAVAVLSVRQLLSSMYNVDHSHRIVRQALQVQENALSMQTGMRGVLLTGSDDAFDPYESREKRTMSNLAELRSSVQGDPTQLSRLDQIEGMIDTWSRNVALPAIRLRQEIGDSKGMDDLAAMVARGTGKQYTDSLREQTRALIDKERLKLQRRETEMIKQSDAVALLRAAEQVERSHEIITQAESIRGTTADMEAAVRGYLLAGKEEFLQPYNEEKDRVLALLNQEKTMVSDDPEQLKLVEQMERTLREWFVNVAGPQVSLRKLISESKTMADLYAFLEKGDDQREFDKFKETMGIFKASVEGAMFAQQAAADQTALTTQRVLIVGTVIVFIAALLISFPLARAITRPLANAVNLAEAISTGDLSKRLEATGTDEVGRLASALNNMLDNLREQTQRTLEGVNVLWSSAAEISSTVVQLGQTTSRMSAAVSETSTTVEEVKQSAQVASERAKKVASDAQQAVVISSAGTKATVDTTDKMNLIKTQMQSIGETVVKLSQQSQAIEDIIGSVQDLADQSNLLAVNASIEAARAGDQGRGFSVVAQEIKSLAEQSRNATAQIRVILDEIRKWISAVVMASEEGGKAVEAGVAQSMVAGDSIHSLAGSLAASSQSAQIIDTSTEQQFVGIDQVAQAMMNIEQAMQQNLAGMTQLEGAARRLEELGESLKGVVERYRI